MLSRFITSTPLIEIAEIHFLCSTMTSLTKIPASTITDPDPKLSTRRAATISFWIVIILGIPFWWKSTSLERLALPRDQVSYWENKIVSSSRETAIIHLTLFTRIVPFMRRFLFVLRLVQNKLSLS